MTRKTTIFILGCGVMQLPALKIAREMGWHVVAADASPQAPGRELCDEFFPVDLKDTAGLIAAAGAIAGGTGPDGVFTAGTDFSESVAVVADALGLPGHSVEAARRATDKVLMRQTFRANNIPSPNFAEVGPNDDAISIAMGIRGPWVVKPVDSMGARGVVRVDDVDQLARALVAARRYSRSGRALVETYMEGPEFSLDALVEEDGFIRCGLADRIIVYPPRFIEIGHSIPSSVDSPTAELIWGVFRRGVEALGLSRGAAKGDVKLTPRGAMIGEIAARLSGGYMSGWTWPYASGVEATRGALRLAVGMSAGDCRPQRRLHCAERALIGIDGRVKRVEGREEAMALPGVKEVFLRYHPGDAISFPLNNVEKVGNVIAVGVSGAQAQDRAITALGLLDLELDPLDARTGLYLDSFDDFPPDCFPVDGFFDRLWSAHPPKPSRRKRPAHLRVNVPLNLPVCVDFAGRSMADVMGKLADRGMLEVVSDPVNAEEAPVMSDFWKALVRGGLPGLRWYLDSSP